MAGSVIRYVSQADVELWDSLDLRLDQYGETPRFMCPTCQSPDGMKVSVPIQLGHCASCGANWDARKLAKRFKQMQPAPEESAEPREAGVEALV
jgi:hypothetical protein